MADINRRQFVKYGFMAAASALAVAVSVGFKKTEGFNVEKNSLPWLGMAEANAMCGAGLGCGGGGGMCGAGLGCSGGGGMCGAGLGCGGGGGMCGAGLGCSGS